MRSFLVVGLLLALFIAACQPSPPTVVYIVVSPTPPDEIPIGSPNAAARGGVARAAVTPTPDSTVNLPTSTPAPTVMPDVVPTNTVAQIQVAEQVYENGRVMWLQPVGEIWVMVVEAEGEGSWLRYEDTFVEGEDLEVDPSIDAPEGFIQPERGFGKLWRENPDVREALGWAVTPEFGYISQYEYRPGGTFKDGAFSRGYGTHHLFSLNGEAFTFDEESSTWELGS